MGQLPASAWWVLALQLTKLLLCWQLPLFGDEAFYWLESQQPAPAFDDVPGLTPWLIALSTAAFGDAAWAIRMPGLLLSWLTLFLLFRAARELGDARLAWRCLLLASLPPIMAMNGVMMLPDVGLNLAIVLCLLGAQRALAGYHSGRWWLAAGVLLGVLAHYRFAVPLAAAGMVLLGFPGSRRLLRWPLLWPPLATLLLGLVPLALDVGKGDGQALSFQFIERHPFHFQPELVFDPLLQAITVSPLLYGLLLWAGWRSRKAPGLLPWAAWGLALLALYWLLGPWVDSERSRLHWPAPAYLALSLPLAYHWPAISSWLRRATLALAGATCVAGSVYLLIISFAPERLVGSSLYPDNFLGAKRLAMALDPALSRLQPGAPLAVDHFLLAAQLEQHFAAAGVPRPVFVLDHPHNSKHGRQGELARLGRDAEALQAERQVDGLLVVTPAALPLRQRAAWLWSLCQRYPQALWQDEHWFDRGDQRFALYRLPAAGSATACRPPVIGYIDLEEGARLSPGAAIAGWAVAGGSGIEELRLRVDSQLIVPAIGAQALPSLTGILGDTGDPAMPKVGWQSHLPAPLPSGQRWLTLEARSAGRDWHPVTALSVEVRDP